MRIEHLGLAVAPPTGWDARIYRRPASHDGQTFPVLHAANFALPTVRGDYGSGAVETMIARELFLALIEFEPRSAGTPLFGRPRPSFLAPETFGPASLQRVLPGQGGAQFFFTSAARAFCLYVVLGSYADRLTLVPQAQAVFTQLEIS